MGDFLHVTSFIDGVLFVQKHDYRYTLNGLRGYTMADKKRHRNKKANDEEKRQRERDIAEELGRTGESEPPIEAAELAYFEKELETLEFPTTGEEIIATVGDHEVESPDETHAVAELVPDTAQVGVRVTHRCPDADTATDGSRGDEKDSGGGWRAPQRRGR